MNLIRKLLLHWVYDDHAAGRFCCHTAAVGLRYHAAYQADCHSEVSWMLVSHSVTVTAAVTCGSTDLCAQKTTNATISRVTVLSKFVRKGKKLVSSFSARFLSISGSQGHLSRSNMAL